MHIKLKALSALKKVTGGNVDLELVEGNTAKNLIEKLDSLYGKAFKKHTGEQLLDVINKYNMIVN